MEIIDLLATDNFIILNKTLAKEIGLENAILFGALCSYQRSFKNDEFYREQDKIMDDTCLTEYAVRKAIKELQQLKLISVIKKGLPAKYYYRINTSRLIDLLSTSGDEICTTSENGFATTNNNNINNNKQNNNTKESIPPSLEEIKAYCKERNNKVDPEAFYNFYESKGWLVGKVKMKSWKACVRTWETRQTPGKKVAPVSKWYKEEHENKQEKQQEDQTPERLITIEELFKVDE